MRAHGWWHGRRSRAQSSGNRRNRGGRIDSPVPGGFAVPLASGLRRVPGAAGGTEGHSAVNAAGSAAEEPMRPHVLSRPDPQPDLREEQRRPRRQTDGRTERVGGGRRGGEMLPVRKASESVWGRRRAP